MPSPLPIDWTRVMFRALHEALIASVGMHFLRLAMQPLMSERRDMEALAQEVQAHPEAYQYERAQRFGVSQQGIG